MKKILIITILATGLSNVTLQTNAQTRLNDLGKAAQSLLKQQSGSNTSNGLSNLQIADGLKEALKIGANRAGSKLSATDGFFRDAAVKILLPKEVQQIENVMRKAGLGSIVDDAILKMNRAAESAAKSATPIFVNAITNMSITDGVNILRGGNNAATNYLQQKTSLQLTNAFRPTIDNALSKTGATKAWKKVFDTYNRIPLVSKKVNSDLSGYVTQQALEGLFSKIAQEEANIRTNPAAQVTNLLKTVFGR